MLTRYAWCNALLLQVLEDDLPDLCLTYKRKVQRQLQEQQKRAANTYSLPGSNGCSPDTSTSATSSNDTDSDTDSRKQAGNGSSGTSTLFCASTNMQQGAAVLPGQHADGALALQQQRANEAKKHVEMKMAEEMLETYEREFRSLEGSLAETEENLDNTRWGH